MCAISRHLHVFFCLLVGWAFTSSANAILVAKSSDGAVITSWNAGSTIKEDGRSIEITIENTGAVAVENVTTEITGSAKEDFTYGYYYGLSIPANSSVRVWLNFLPKALGERTAQFVITSSTPGYEHFSINLSGTGSTVFEPIYNEPDFVPFSGYFNASAYSIGVVTINFRPRAIDELVIARMFDGRFTNYHEPVRVKYQGKIYLYELALRYPFNSPYGYTYKLVMSGVKGGEDPSFIHSISGTGGTVAVQPNGKLIVTGSFLNPGGTANQRIARLDPDGRIDATFSAVVDGIAACVFIQEDGKILIAGPFSTVNGKARPGLARLHPDGSLDEGFVFPGNTLVGRVMGLADGKILIGGNSSGVMRLNADGSIDHSFDSAVTSADAIYSLAVAADGRILVGGIMYVGDARQFLCRLHPDGSLDASFQGVVNSSVSAIIIQPDGKLLISGGFSVVNGQLRRAIARLHPNGSLDEDFIPDPDGFSSIHSMVLQTDGRILVGSGFISSYYLRPSLLARLETDGTVDATFSTPEMFWGVTGLSMSADGSVYVTAGHLHGKGLLKLLNHSGVSDFRVTDHGGLKWTRTGTVPDLDSVVFDYSGDQGRTWMVLGEGSRVADGWVLEGAPLPVAGFLRARGRALGSNRGYALIQETKIHGRPLTALEEWREARFGSPLDEWPGGDEDDFDGDGKKNLIEFGFGLDPKVAATGELPSWRDMDTSYEISFTKPASVSGITYSAEWSTTMREDDWHPAEDLSLGDQKSFRVPVGAEEKKFFRLRVAVPPAN